MGFIVPKGGGEEDGGAGGSGGSGLELDLDLKACGTCRRELLPWQDTCPDDGGPAVRKADLTAPRDPLAARLAALLDDEPDEPGESDEPA